MAEYIVFLSKGMTLNVEASDAVEAEQKALAQINEPLWHADLAVLSPIQKGNK